MEPRDLLRVITRRLWAIVAVALIGVVLAGLSVLTSQSVYQATARVFVSTRTATNLSDVNQGAVFTQQIVKSYAEVADSPVVLAPVIQELKLPLTVDELTKQVHVTAALDTVIIDIAVDDSDPVQARQIADAISSRLSREVGSLSTLNSDVSAVQISRIQAATLAPSRVSPKPATLLPIGGLVGLLVGILGVLGVEALTRRIRSTRDAARIGGLPVLAGLPSRRAKLARHPVVAGASGSDGYRALRASLAARTTDEGSRSIVVTGAHRRAGSTTVAANLAIALAEGGTRVALVEANLRTPSLSAFLDLPTMAGLDDVLSGEIALDTALTAWGEHGLMVLVAAPVPGGSADLLESAALRALTADLASRFDVVLYDAPDLAGSSEASALAARLDGAVVVVECGRTRSPVLRDGLDSIAALDGTAIGLVVARLPRRGQDAPRIRT